MEPIELPGDFSEFLRSLDANEVEYLMVGGFAVAHHGEPRATADLDVWVSRRHENAVRIVSALRQFGFDSPDLENLPQRLLMCDLGGHVSRVVLRPR